MPFTQHKVNWKPTPQPKREREINWNKGQPLLKRMLSKYVPKSKHNCSTTSNSSTITRVDWTFEWEV